MPKPRKPPPPARAPAGWIVGAAVAAIGVVGALLYAKSSAAVVGYRLLADGGIAGLWLASAAGLGSLLLRPFRVFPLESPRDRPGAGLLELVTSAALGLGAIGLATLGLGLAGLLRQTTAVALLAPGLLAGGLRLLAMHRAERSKPVGAAMERPSPWRWLWLAAGPFLAVALVGDITPPGLLWTPNEPHGYDVVEYHLQVPREWYEAGRIVPLRHNIFSYMPMGVEVHYLLAMHLVGGPWQAMYLAALMHLAFVGLAALAVAAIAGLLAPRRASAIVAAVTLATTPWLAQLGAIAYNDGGMLLYAALAVGWSILAVASAKPGRRFALAGTLAGLGCGVKLTGVPELLLALPLAILIARLAPIDGERTDPSGRLRAGAQALKGIAVFVIAGLLVFSPWLARTAAWAGNPLFPEAARWLGKAHWDDVRVERYRLANHEPGAGERGPLGRVRAGWTQVLGSWQFGYLLFPLALAAVIRRLIRERRPGAAGPAPRPPPELVLPAALLVLLGIFWIGFTHVQGRFFLPAALLAALLVAQVDWGRALPAVACLALLAAGAGFVRLHGETARVLWRQTPDGRDGIYESLGNVHLDWLTPDGLEQFPTGSALAASSARLTLVGEGRAFYYQVPMSRLVYRTIFDLDTADLPPSPSPAAMVDAWAGRPPGAPAPSDEWLVINGPELKRFHDSYYDVPPPPAAWKMTDLPFAVPPPASRPGRS